MSFDIPNPKLNKTNPHFGSKYADLAELVRVTAPFLKAQSADVQQTTLLADQTLMFVTRLIDSEGKAVREVAFPFPTTGKAQELGSALTYCRRYGLALLFNLVGEEDDDGNAAQGAKPQAKSKGRKPAVKKTTPKAAAPKAKPPADEAGDEDWY